MSRKLPKSHIVKIGEKYDEDGEDDTQSLGHKINQFEDTRLPYDFEDDLSRFIVRDDYVTWEHNNQLRDGFLP